MVSWQNSLDGRVAIVTGAAQGIGFAAATALAQAGARVVINDVRKEAAAEAAATLCSDGWEAIALAGDVTHRKEVDSVVQAVLGQFGKVDILVNNAGVLRSSAVADIAEDEWDFVVDSNLKGAFLFSQAVLPTMMAARQGRILNVASLAGKATSTLGGAHYTAAKAGVLGLTRHLAREVGTFHINVNAICPGIVSTPMVSLNIDEAAERRIINNIPFGRFAAPEEIARLILFLVSDEASYITGAAVDIHGGEMIFH